MIGKNLCITTISYNDPILCLNYFTCPENISPPSRCIRLHRGFEKTLPFTVLLSENFDPKQILIVDHVQRQLGQISFIQVIKTCKAQSPQRVDKFFPNLLVMYRSTKIVSPPSRLSFKMSSEDGKWTWYKREFLELRT